MKYTERARLVPVLLLLAALGFVGGCGKKDPTDSPHVAVLLGDDGYKEAAAKVKVGQTVKVKGEIALAGSKGNKVSLHLAKLYSGDATPIPATQLTKDIITNRPAVEEKYRKLGADVVVEGVVAEMQPGNYSIILEGHK